MGPIIISGSSDINIFPGWKEKQDQFQDSLNRVIDRKIDTGQGRVGNRSIREIQNGAKEN